MARLSAVFFAIILGACATAEPVVAGSVATVEDLVAAEDVRADLAALYQGLQGAHYDLYAHTPKDEYDRLYAETLASIREPVSRLQAHALLQRFAAAGRVAHASLGFPSEAFSAFREGGGRVFPLLIRIQDQRFYVARNLSADPSIAPGDEVLAINGTSATQWLLRVSRNVSADTDSLASAQIEPAFFQLLWLELGEVDAFDVALRRANGAEAVIRVAARTRAEMSAAAETVPAAFALDYTERVAQILPNGVAYLRPGIFLNVESDDMYDARAFHAFIDDAFEAFLAADADALLIDLRDNPGGDNSFSDYMIAQFADRPFRFASSFRIRVSAEAIASNAARLPTAQEDSVSRRLAEAYAEASVGDVVDFPIPMVAPHDGARFERPVYVLVNRRSFSNSVLTAAIVQDYGFGRVLGEPTSDLATTYGAMEQFTLPNTRLSVGFPKAHIVRPSGDTRIRGVAPDIAITTPIIQASDDPVLQEALGVVVSHRR